MTSLIVQGSPISYSSISNPSIFISLGWSTDVWQFGSKPYQVKELEPYIPGADSRTLTIQGNPIQNNLSYYQSTYLNNNWDMERIWVINEGISRPRLIKRVDANYGVGLTHGMSYLYVVPHIDGTMNYLGVTWKSRGVFFRFPDPPAKGVLNQEVTYSIPDSDLTQTIVHEDDGSVNVVWFASGVRDTLGAGGFSGYNDQKTRSTTVRSDASASVNFYFTQAKYLPTKNYRASISTPDGIIDIAVVTRRTSPICFSLGGGVVLNLPIVDVDDEMATKIHVMTNDGIKALQTYVEFNGIQMLED